MHSELFLKITGKKAYHVLIVENFFDKSLFPFNIFLVDCLSNELILCEAIIRQKRYTLFQ